LAGVLLLLMPAGAWAGPDEPPATATGLVARAQRALRDYDDAEAERLLRQALERDSGLPSAHRELGLLLARRYRYEDAERHLSSFLDERPQPDPLAQAARARMRFALLQWDGALSDALAVLAAPPGEADESVAAEMRGLSAALRDATPRHAIEVRDPAGRLQCVLRASGDTEQARWYARSVATAFAQVESLAGQELPPVGLILLRDGKAMNRWSRAFAGRKAPGCAFCDHRVIVLELGANRYKRDDRAAEEHARMTVLRHELIHHMVDALAGARTTPKWLNEGIAECFCRRFEPAEPVPDAQRNFGWASRVTPEWYFLASQPEQMDERYYAFAAQFVRLACEKAPAGEGWVRRFLDARGAGRSTDEAFSQSVGMAKEDLFGALVEAAKAAR